MVSGEQMRRTRSEPLVRSLLVGLGMLLATVTAAWAGPKAAIFPLELADFSLEGQYAGTRADETQRLAMATDELRRLAARDAGYEVVDLTGIASEIARAAPLHKCNGCALDLARQAGADIAVLGVIQKISNLVLEAHLFLIDVQGGKVTKRYRVELRGNSDETWLRAVRRLVTEHLARG